MLEVTQCETAIIVQDTIPKELTKYTLKVEIRFHYFQNRIMKHYSKLSYSLSSAGFTYQYGYKMGLCKIL